MVRRRWRMIAAGTGLAVVAAAGGYTVASSHAAPLTTNPPSPATASTPVATPKATLTPAAPTPSPDVTPQSTRQPQSTPRAKAAPDASVTAPPDKIVAAAKPAKGVPLVVTSTRIVNGTPTFTRIPATSEADAVTKVAAEQDKREGLVAVGLDQRVKLTAVDQAPAPVNDARWRDQYALSNQALGGLSTENKPDALEAIRRIGTGKGVTVAVVDVGVRGEHPDLQGNVLPGPSFLEGFSTDNDAHRTQRAHGTHVAGIIAATTGNGTGVASLAADAKILPIKVLGENGFGWDSDVAKGVVYAVDQGAKIINLSLTSSAPTLAMWNAVTYARTRGVILVAAAGNEAEKDNRRSYPAAYSGVIAVGAVDSTDARAAFSNTGDYVTLTAPGAGVLSTAFRDAGDGVPTYTYERWDGTSMAAPAVSATLAVMAQAAPNTSWEQRLAALMSTVAKKDSAATRTDEYGFGILRVLPALQKLTAGAAPKPDPQPAPNPAPAPPVPVPSKPATVNLTMPSTQVTAGSTIPVTLDVVPGAQALANCTLDLVDGTKLLARATRLTTGGKYRASVKVTQDMSLTGTLSCPKTPLVRSATVVVKALLTAKLQPMLGGTNPGGVIRLQLSNAAAPVTFTISRQVGQRWQYVTTLRARAGQAVYFRPMKSVQYQYVATAPGFATPLTGYFSFQ